MTREAEAAAPAPAAAASAANAAAATGEHCLTPFLFHLKLQPARYQFKTAWNVPWTKPRLWLLQRLK
jgi:hypothetical protein